MSEICPSCLSTNIKKNGHSKSSRKQNNYCHSCGRNFVDNPEKKYVSEQEKLRIDKALLERVSLRGICRIFSVTLKWLMSYFHIKCCMLPEDLAFDMDLANKIHTSRTKSWPVIFCEADELCTYVKNKKNKAWLWIAIDCETRQVIAFHIGNRSKISCKKLWNKIPKGYKNRLYMFTDHFASYKSVIPSHQHQDVDKGTGLTNTIEGFNNIMRQRVSRLVRKTASFSKLKENLIKAIHLFIVDYNLTQQMKFE